jgi:ATP-dependent helicase/nuclease subunit B
VSGFLDAPGPRWFTIAPHRPFLADLAEGLAKALPDAEALSRAVVLLPNRRAGRELAAAFVGLAKGGAIMPPQMRALGDLDAGEPPFEPGDLALDLPPAISAARRRYELAGLAVRHEGLLGRGLDAAAALDMADALARFLDGIAIEEAGDGLDLAALVEGDLAGHWRRTADYLAAILADWPRRLAELEVMDVADRRVALLRALARRWRDHSPGEPIVAAGSTGSTPATAAVLTAVAAAPQGAVVLPGLDLDLAEDAWVQVGEEHPQGAMRRLLAGAGVAREEVRSWSGEPVDASRWRRRLINEALRPAKATADWLRVIGDLQAQGPIAEGLRGLTLVGARDEEEAAAVAALVLREALETPGRTAALVTPDAALARRVSARLTRWNIAADSSMGAPLAASPPGVLAVLAARPGFEPVRLLALAKHPLVRLGLRPGALERAREVLERHGLRGPTPGGWGGLEARLAGRADALDFAGRLKAALAALEAVFASSAAAPALAARALAATLETLTAGPGGEAGEMWSGQAGAAVAAALASLIGESEALPPATASGFAELVASLLAAETLRPGGASHGRLRILGVLEARLARADLMVLAGLEEGVWPSPAPVDPFLSRPMRAALGLPPPERRLGLAAHDFAQAACAGEVTLIASARRGGAPAVESRWLWRLRTLAKGAGLEIPARPELIAWARTLDGPLAEPPPSLRLARRPEPRPKVAERPRQLPVTSVETWVRDPYAIYARHVLRLRPLDPPGGGAEVLARGSAIHRAFERFAQEHPGALPTDGAALFEALVLEELSAAGMPAAALVREAALARNLSAWVMDFEARRRPEADIHVERSGELTFDAPAGPFTLTARADRIEARAGTADILDFKTGIPPSDDEIASGLAPQLTLTAAILAAGGFAGVGNLAPGQLLYVKVSGGRVAGLEAARGAGEEAALAEAALANLKRRIARFDDPATPYLSRLAPKYVTSAGDYDALARVWEWQVLGEEAGE